MKKFLFVIILLLLFALNSTPAPSRTTLSNFSQGITGQIASTAGPGDTITVSPGANTGSLPATGPFDIVVYTASCTVPSSCTSREVIRIASRSGNSLVIQERNRPGSTVSGTWLSGSKYIQTILKEKFDEIEAELDSIGTGTAGSGNATSYKGVSAPTGTEFGYLSGVTSGIQAQLNSKIDTSGNAATATSLASDPSPASPGYAITGIDRYGNPVGAWQVLPSVIGAAPKGYVTPATRKCAEIDEYGYIQIAQTNDVCGTGGTGLSSSLTAGHLFIGNGSNVATDLALSGDVSLNSAGTTTVTGIGGKSITPSAGYLKYTGSAWSFDNSTFLSSTQTITIAGDASGSSSTGTITVSVDKYKGTGAPSATEFGYLSGVTSAIQTQLNGKLGAAQNAATASALAATPTKCTAASGHPAISGIAASGNALDCWDVTAANVGAVPSNGSLYIGTTSVPYARSSGALSLAGVSIDGSAGSVPWSGVSSKPNLASSITCSTGYVIKTYDSTTGAFTCTPDSTAAISDPTGTYASVPNFWVYDSATATQGWKSSWGHDFSDDVFVPSVISSVSGSCTTENQTALYSAAANPLLAQYRCVSGSWIGPLGDGGGSGVGADAGAYYLVTKTTPSTPANATNLGALSSGILKQTVAAGQATMSIAAANTDYSLVTNLTCSTGYKMSGYNNGTITCSPDDTGTGAISAPTGTYASAYNFALWNPINAQYEPFLGFDYSFGATYSLGLPLKSAVTASTGDTAWDDSATQLKIRGSGGSKSFYPVSNWTVGKICSAAAGGFDCTNTVAGTVTSVGLTLPNIFSVSGSPVTGASTIAASLASQTGNYFFAAPNGSSGTPSFRAIALADLPVITGQYGGTGVANTGKTITLGGSLTTSGAYAVTLTATGTTNVTLPTSGALLSSSTASTGATNIVYSDGPTLKGQKETVVAGGTCSTSYNVDPTAGTMVTLTLSGACQIGVTNLSAGHSFSIKLTQSSTTAPTFTAAYKWASATAPTWSTSATKYDIISCASFDGTTLQCAGIVDVR